MNILVVNDLRTNFHSVRPELEMILLWRKAGHKVTVFTPQSNCIDKLRAGGVTVSLIQLNGKLSLRTIFAIRRELKYNSYDIVYATGSRTIPNAAFAAIGFPVKLVVYRGTCSGLYRSDPTAYLTVLHPRVDAIACASHAVEEHVRNQIRNKKTLVTTIHKGHDLNWYKDKPADLGEFGIHSEAFVAIAVATFRPSKGLTVLLHAARQLAHLENFHLLIVGPGSNKEPYASIIKSHPMSDRIHAAGFRVNAPAYIAAADILVQPSISGEGLPRTVVEGMAYGIPSIASKTGGAKEIIDEGVNGYVIPVNDPNAIAKKIEYALAHKSELHAMSARCTAKIAQDLSVTKSANDYLTFFTMLSQDFKKSKFAMS